MKEKKIVMLSVLILIIIFGGMALSAFLVKPSENCYALATSPIDEEYALGQEIELTAKLKNKSVFLSKVTRGFSFIYINFYSDDENEISDRIGIPSISITDTFLPFELKAKTEKFTPEQTGDYSVEIYAKFSIGAKTYDFLQIVKFKVA